MSVHSFTIMHRLLLCNLSLSLFLSLSPSFIHTHTQSVFVYVREKESVCVSCRVYSSCGLLLWLFRPLNKIRKRQKIFFRQMKCCPAFFVATFNWKTDSIFCLFVVVVVVDPILDPLFFTLPPASTLDVSSYIESQIWKCRTVNKTTTTTMLDPSASILFILDVVVQLLTKTTLMFLLCKNFWI